MTKTLAFLLAGLAISASAQTYVQPHVTSNGTYVEGYYKTNPNGTKLDNYSTQGNVNPYTGQAGTVNPYPNPNNYQSQPRTGFEQKQCGYTQSGQYVCR